MGPLLSAARPRPPQHGVALAAPRVADPDDLVVLVDRGDVALLPADRAEVGDLAVLPQEAVALLTGLRDLRLEAGADDLAAVVDRDRAAVRVGAAEGAEVGQLAVLPEEAVRPTLGGDARPDDLAALVDRERDA